VKGYARALVLSLAATADAQDATAPWSVSALLRDARALAQAGDAKGAGDRIRRALELAPNSEDVLFAHAQMALSERSLEEALFDLDALARISPEVSQYHYLLGVALMQAGDMTAAAEALERAQAIEPDRPHTLVALGLAWNSRRRHQEAHAVLRRSLDFAPDNLEAIAALAEAEEGVGRWEDAKAHARQVLARIPGHATANLVMGLLLMKEERYAEAREAFLKAAEAELVSPKPHYQLSLAYARLGDETRAREHLELYQRRQREMEDRVRELRGLPPLQGAQ
jgi:tetratricopeptide (TPR) repeat protein